MAAYFTGDRLGTLDLDQATSGPGRVLAISHRDSLLREFAALSHRYRLLIHGRQGSMKVMPKLPQPIIEVAWRHRGEQGKIHYRAKRPDGSNRHLIAREGDALYVLLETHLQAIRYTGPRSAAEESAEH